MQSGSEAAVWYVDGGVEGSGSGVSWSEAFKTIQEAITAADEASGDEIWIKAGTYSISLTVTVDKAVAIYGGFDGTETDRDERDWVNNVTTIEGEGSARCLYITADATIDGLTISRGNATGVESLGGGIFNDSCAPTISNCIVSENVAIYGGGIANISANPTITSCTLSENFALEDGGGLSNDQSSPNISECSFSGNSATGRGGGIWNAHSSPTISECTFSNNSGDWGGGVADLSSSLTMVDCTLLENAGNDGGGIATHDSSLTITGCTFWVNHAEVGGGMHATLSSPIMINCTFWGNIATSLGGGIYNYFSSGPRSTTITNCTFWGNSADYGGGMYNVNCTISLTNCVLWGNEAPDGPEIYTQVGSPAVSYCDIDQEGYAGIDGNIREDPRLVNPDNGDLHLQLDSPCIDAGTNSAPEIPGTDFEGDPRVFDGDNDGTATVDMGIDEYVPYNNVTVIVPNGGETLPTGLPYLIRWGAPSHATSFRLKYSMNNGQKWELIKKDITGRDYEWTVPVTKKNTKRCLVRVIGYDGSDKKVGADTSDEPFTIEVVRVTSPDGGETLTSGDPQTITWTTHETKKDVERVTLLYTKNGAKRWNKIATLNGNPGSYDEWTVPDVPKTKSKCKVKVVLKDVNGKTVGRDRSDGYFTIGPGL